LKDLINSVNYDEMSKASPTMEPTL